MYNLPSYEHFLKRGYCVCMFENISNRVVQYQLIVNYGAFTPV